MNRVHAPISWLLAALAAAYGVAASAAGNGPGSPATPVTRKGDSVLLKTIEPLKEAFQHDAGKIRLVTILSPT